MHGVDKSSGDHLKSFIERVERLEEEKKALADDIKEVFAEMKAMGFDAKAIRQILKMRKQEPHVIEEEQAVLDTYLAALNGWDNTPLGSFGTDEESYIERKQDKAYENIVNNLVEDGVPLEKAKIDALGEEVLV